MISLRQNTNRKLKNHSYTLERNFRLIQLATVKTANINKSYKLFVFFVMLKVLQLSCQNEFYCFGNRALFKQVLVLFCIVFVPLLLKTFP